MEASLSLFEIKHPLLRSKKKAAFDLKTAFFQEIDAYLICNF
jgi:hypothetical protein